LLNFCINAQDTIKLVEYTKNYIFKEGVFVTFEDVLKNSPINKSRIVCNLEKDSYDFYDLLINEKEVSILQDDGQFKKYDPSKFWGYAQNGKISIYWESKAVFVPIVGSISHFVGTVTVTDYPYTSDPFGYYSQPNQRQETVQFIIDFRNGTVFEFNDKNLEPILATDEELYKEWIDISKRKRKKLIFVYLQKYNERNPLLLPENN